MAESTAIGVALVAGLAVRIWILRHPLGSLDSDEAVIGLMADRIRHGHLVAFFWGQSYGAPVEAFLAAPLLAAFKGSVLALKAVPMGLSAAAAVLTWRIGRLLASPAAGRWAGALFWLWPPAFVYWSTKTAVYWGSLVLALLAVWLLCRLAAADRPPATKVGTEVETKVEARVEARPRRLALEYAALGLAVGLAWWANPQTLYLIAPAAIWCSATLVRRWAYLPATAAGALVGAAPWLRSNLIHRWASLHFAPQPAVAGGYWGRLHGFFRLALPETLSLRASYSGDWVLGAVGKLAYVVLLAAFGIWLAVTLKHSFQPGATGLARAPLLVALVAVAYPFLFAASPFSWYVDFPRYLLFLAPAVAILLGLAAARSWLWLPVVAIAGLLTVTGVGVLNASGLARPHAPDARVPANLAALQGLLSRYRIHDAYADYWLAYRTTFQTGETTLVDPTFVVRDPVIDAEVRASPDPAYLFVSASQTLGRFEQACQRLGIPVAIHSRGRFTVVLPGRKLLPGQAGQIWKP